MSIDPGQPIHPADAPSPTSAKRRGTARPFCAILSPEARAALPVTAAATTDAIKPMATAPSSGPVAPKRLRRAIRSGNPVIRALAHLCRQHDAAGDGRRATWEGSTTELVTELYYIGGDAVAAVMPLDPRPAGRFLAALAARVNGRYDLQMTRRFSRCGGGSGKPIWVIHWGTGNAVATAPDAAESGAAPDAATAASAYPPISPAIDAAIADAIEVATLDDAPAPESVPQSARGSGCYGGTKLVDPFDGVLLRGFAPDAGRAWNGAIWSRDAGRCFKHFYKSIYPDTCFCWNGAVWNRNHQPLVHPPGEPPFWGVVAHNFDTSAAAMADGVDRRPPKRQAPRAPACVAPPRDRDAVIDLIAWWAAFAIIVLLAAYVAAPELLQLLH